MSSELRYKESIVNNEWEQWKLTDARIVAGKLLIEPGGSVQYIKAPTAEEEKAIPQKFKVVITYETGLSPLYSNAEYMFEIHMPPNKNNNVNGDGVYKSITTPVHPNTTNVSGTLFNKCVTYVDAKGGTTEYFKIVYRNNSKSEITINSISVHPSYAVDDNTLAEIEQHIPSTLHYTNSDRLYITTDGNLVTMDIGTVMNTNLQVHFMANGVVTDDCDIQLEFLVDKEHLPYSPIDYTLPAGRFLIGIPINIMQVESGNNKLEINLKISNGSAEIQPFKVQCTVDGKGMLSKSSSSAPSIDEVLLIPTWDISQVGEIAHTFVEHSEIIPSPVGAMISIPFINIDEIGYVEDIIDIEQTRVAEDVWFGPTWDNGYDPCTHEKFTYNEDIIKKHSGKLQFKQMDSNTLTLEHTHTWLGGDVYSITLDNSETSKYERLRINPRKRGVKIHDIRLNTDNFTEIDGYNMGDTIGIITEHNEKCTTNLQSDNETFTYVTVEVDENNFNEIKELQ